MSFEDQRIAAAAAWTTVVTIIAIGASITTAAGWSGMAGLALIPPVMFMRLWPAPAAQTVSPSVSRPRR